MALGYEAQDCSPAWLGDNRREERTESKPGSVFMYSPSLELGKREGQLPLVQVPIVHSAWQLSWVLELAKSTEQTQKATT